MANGHQGQKSTVPSLSHAQEGSTALHTLQSSLPGTTCPSQELHQAVPSHLITHITHHTQSAEDESTECPPLRVTASELTSEGHSRGRASSDRHHHKSDFCLCHTICCLYSNLHPVPQGTACGVYPQLGPHKLPWHHMPVFIPPAGRQGASPAAALCRESTATR